MKTWLQALLITLGLFIFSALAYFAKITFLSLANIVAYPLLMFYLSGIGAALLAFLIIGLVLYLLSYFLISLFKSFKNKNQLK